MVKLQDTNKPDAGLRALFHKNLPGHWTTIETGAVSTGVPDSSFCIRGVEGMIEFKRTESYGVVRVRPAQSAWLFRRWMEGGNCWIAVRLLHDGGPRKGAPEDSLFLIRGKYAPDLIRAGLSSVPYEGRWDGSPTLWRWEEIALHLERPRRWDPSAPDV